MSGDKKVKLERDENGEELPAHMKVKMENEGHADALRRAEVESNGKED